VYARELILSADFLRKRKEEGEMTSKDTGTGFGIGFIVGVAVGLAVGFLYAPRPGVETREQLKEKVAEVKEKAAGVVEKVKETAAEVKQKAQEKLRPTE
jgi:gas vesicle protein